MIPLALIPHPAIGPIVHDTFTPGITGGLNSTALLTIIAIVGTTVAPWQLFFQQSNVVDKRITARWVKNERTDTIIGAFLTNIEAGGLIIAAAFVFVGQASPHSHAASHGHEHASGWWGNMQAAIPFLSGHIHGEANVDTALESSARGIWPLKELVPQGTSTFIFLQQCIL